MAHPTTIRTLLRHAGRWAIAAVQDNEPAIRMLHANYAVGYMLALREVASDAQVLAVTGYDPFDLFQELLQIQDNAMHQAAAACPTMVPSPRWLAEIAGDARAPIVTWRGFVGGLKPMKPTRS